MDQNKKKTEESINQLENSLSESKTNIRNNDFNRGKENE